MKPSPRMQMRFVRARTTAFAAALLCAPFAGHSQTTSIWDGGASGSWTNPVNWVGDVELAPGNDVIFYETGAGTLMTALHSNWVVNTLGFSSNASGTVVITNSTLTLTGGIVFDPLAGTSNVIASTIVISNDQTWYLNSGQTLVTTLINDPAGNDRNLTISNGTVVLNRTSGTSQSSINQFRLREGATLRLNNNNHLGDTTTSVDLDSTSTLDFNNFTDAWRGISGAGLVTNYGAGNFDLRPIAGDHFVFSGTVHATNNGVGGSWFMQGATTIGTQVFETTLPFQQNIQILQGVGALAGVSGDASAVTNVINIGDGDLEIHRFGTNAVLLLDSSGANHASQNRLNDATPIRLRGSAELRLVGNDSADTTETVGLIRNNGTNALTGYAPRVVVSVDAGTGAGARLTSAELQRFVNGGTFLFRGDNLGMAGIGAGTSLITFTTSPTLSSNGALGTPQAGILPYAIGDNNPNGDGAELVTYGANGIRLLTASEYTNAFATGEAANVELTSTPAALAANATELALKLNGAGVSVDLGGNTLALTAGAILSSGSGANAINNGSLTFGTNLAADAEGFIYTLQDLSLNASITDNAASAVSLTKSGAGTLYVNAAQGYSGKTSIDGGSVVVTVDNAWTNVVSLDGSLFVSNTVYHKIGMLAGTARSTINIGTNATFEITGGAGNRSFYGTFQGPSTADIVKSGGNTESIYGDSTATFSGEVYVLGGTLLLIDNDGRLADSAFFISSGGLLDLDNDVANSNNGEDDRLDSSKFITFNRGSFAISASNNDRIDENVGDFVFQGAYNTITLESDGSPGTANGSDGDVRLTADVLTRQNRATGLIRGTRLGDDIAGTAQGQANFLVDNAHGTNYLSNQSWTNKAPGSTSLPIVPWLTGGTNLGDPGTTFITYQTNFGFRPLDETTEFVNQSFGAAGTLNAGTASNNHLRIAFTANNSDATLGAGTNLAVLGLLLDNIGGSGSDVQIGANILTIESGLILSSGSQDNEIIGTGGITFGPNEETGFEGRIHAARNISITAPIIDNVIGGVTNAVSMTFDGTTVTLNTPATYSGDTYINSGTLQLGVGNNRLPTNTVLTINGDGKLQLNSRDQIIGGLQGIGFVQNENNTAANDSVLTIDVTNAATSYTFGGTLRNRSAFSATEAPLRLVKAGAGTQILGGTNTYTGGTTVNGGTLIALHAAAYPIFTNAAAAIAGATNFSLYTNLIANSGGTLAVRGGRPTEWSPSEVTMLLSNASFASGSFFGIDVDAGQTFEYPNAVSNAPGISTVMGFAKSGSGTNVLSGGLSIPEDVAVRGGLLVLSNGPAGARDVLVTDGAALFVDPTVSSNGFRDFGHDSTGTSLLRGANTFVRDVGAFRGTLSFTNLDGIMVGRNVLVSNGAAFRVAYGEAALGDIYSYGTTYFSGRSNQVGNVSALGGGVSFFSDYNVESNLTASGGGDFTFGNEATDRNVVRGDIVSSEDPIGSTVISFANGTNVVHGSISLLNWTNSSSVAELNFFAPKTIVYGDVRLQATNGQPGRSDIDVGNSFDDSTEIYGSLIIDTPGKGNQTSQEFSRGDLWVSNNIVLNPSKVDFKQVSNYPIVTNYGGTRLVIEADFDTNITDGVGFLDRLRDGTLAGGSDGIVINDYSAIQIYVPSSNMTFTLGQKITVDQQGPTYWYVDGRTIQVLGGTNLIGGTPGAKVASRVDLTNVWMRDGAFMRIGEATRTGVGGGATPNVRVGLTLDGPATNGVAYLSDGASGNNDPFDLLDVRSSTPGVAKVLQIGTTNGRYELGSYVADEIPLVTKLLGTASTDITLDVFNGRLTVTNGQGDVQGGVKVHQGSVFEVVGGAEGFNDLSGNGTVIGSVIVSNTLSPGLSPGTLTVTGDVTFVTSSILQFELAGTNTLAGGGINDLLQLVGVDADLTLEGELRVFDMGTSFAGRTTNDFWTLITFTGDLLSSNLALNLAYLPTLDPGYGWTLDYLTQPGEVRLAILVPEPGAWVWMFVGVALAVFLARRRRCPGRRL